MVSVQIRYDPFDASILNDPYPTYRLLRDTAPVYRAEEPHTWVLSRHADVQAAAEFAVATRAEKEQKEMELVDVLVAEKQVVAGTNYRLCLKVDSEAGEGQDYVTIFVQAVVYVDLKGNKKLSSWAISDCGGEDDG